MGIIWELDFYSRPILDEQGKKLWEVVICESPQETSRSLDSLFRYAQFCSSNQVNSVWLRTALEDAIATSAQNPTKIRFFRRQMTNMITTACKGLGITAQPSRRTIALYHWLEQRMQQIYPTLSGYQAGQTTPIVFATSFESAPAQPLPDALRGEQWAFVNLEVSAFAEMSEWSIDFSEAFPLEMVELSPGTQIPGLIIFSTRALALAGWLSGLEIACLKFEPAPSRLILETGVSDRWILANLNRPQLQQEAQAFEVAKEQAQKVHFLATQSDSQSESFTGFWLLQELDLA